MKKDDDTDAQEVREYQPPKLVLVGDAASVVLGEINGGWDYYSMTEPRFEFERDADEDVLLD